MTYNNFGGPPPAGFYPFIPAGELSPDARVPATVAKVRTADPDVIGWQEFDWDAPAGQSIREQLADYTWLNLGAGVPIAARTSRFEVVDTGQDVISDSASPLDRWGVWAKLRDTTTGACLVAFNVHQHPWQLDEWAAMRSATMTRLIALMRRVDPGLATPFVVFGDFNARSDETRPVYRDHLTKFQAAGIVDSFAVAAKDASDVPKATSFNQMAATVNGTQMPKAVKTQQQSRHYDYVWVPKRATVASWATVSGPGIEWRKVGRQRVAVWAGIVSSDHSPVVARVAFRE